MAKKSKNRKTIAKRKSMSLKKKLKKIEGGLAFYEYKITSEPIKNPQIPSEIEGEVEDLFYESQEKPREAIPRLELLIEKYPAVPPLYNYLSIAYARIGNNNKADEIIETNYKNNPNGVVE